MDHTFLQEFLEESYEYVEDIDRTLLSIESQIETDHSDEIKTIFRHLHTLKGSSKSVNLNNFAEDIHIIEAVYTALMEKKLTLDVKLLKLLFDSNDHLTDYISSIKNDQHDHNGPSFLALKSRIEAVASVESKTKQSSGNSGLFLFDDEPEPTISNIAQTVTKQDNRKPTEKSVEKLKKILVIDDDTSILLLVQNQLDQFYQIETESNPHKALQLLRKHRYDLVLLDYSIPEFDGLQIMHEIKKLKQYVPVVIMSAMSSRAIIIQFLKLGAVDFLDKPFKLEQLNQSVFRGINKGTVERCIDKLSAYSFRLTMHTEMLLGQKHLNIKDNLRNNLKHNADSISQLVFSLNKSLEKSQSKSVY